MPFWTAAGADAIPGTPDSEVSKNGGVFADCTNEVTLIKEVGGVTDSAEGWMTLTGQEMTADVVVYKCKSTNCITAKVILTPRRIMSVLTGNFAAMSTPTTAKLPAAASSQDDYYNGWVIRNETQGEARFARDYSGTNKSITIDREWDTAPVETDTFTLGPLLSDAENPMLIDATISSRVSANTGGIIRAG